MKASAVDARRRRARSARSSVRRQRSTTVRPRQSSEAQSIATCRRSVSTRSGPEHVRDRDCVVDRRAVEARRSASGSGCRTRPARRRASRSCPPHVAGRRAAGVRQGLVGHVEADHRHVEAAGEHPRRGLRVGPDVELRRRRHVSLGDRAAHERRSARASRSGWRASRSATFVSGPTATSVAPRRVLGREEVDRVLRPGAPAAGGRPGPSSPVSPWT